MAFPNHATTVAAEKTVDDISKLLIKAGASRISTDYVAQQLESLTFQMVVGPRKVSFRLPAKWERVLRAMKASGVDRRYQNEAQARRVAWRAVREWLRGQLVLMETGQAEMSEALLAYALVADGSTLYARMKAADEPIPLLIQG